MIPSYTTINTLKSKLNTISIRFIMQVFQLKAFFKSNPDLYKNSSKRIFIKFKIEHESHVSMSFIIFDKFYDNIIYNSSILVSSLSDSTYRGTALRGRFISHFIKYIKNEIEYDIKNKFDDLIFDNMIEGDYNLISLLQSWKLSLNNVNILTARDIRLIEIVNDKTQESYLIFHKRNKK